MIRENMTKALCLGVLAGVMVPNAEGGDNRALLDKLVEKGIITQEEADDLLKESQNEFAGKNAMSTALGGITLKGDLRLRYDHTKDSDSEGSATNDRWRYRFRFGGEAQMKNGFKTGFRFATGGNDASSDIGSTNQTMDKGFGRDDFGVDQAYVSWNSESADLSPGKEWSMDEGFTIFGGKNPNWSKRGWNVSKAFFDSDITPEGFETHYATEGTLPLGLHFGAYFINGENSGASEDIVNMYMAQVTSAISFNETTKLDVGLGMYSVDDEALSGSGHGKIGKEARVGNSSGIGYSPLFLDGKLGLKGIGNGVSLYTTYFNNQESQASKDTGYVAGIKYGSAKKAGTWEAKIEHRSIEADAAWEGLMHSDFGAFGAAGGSATGFGSGTNVEGYIVQGKYNLYENVQFALTWLHTESEDGTDGDDNNRFQADIIFKF